MIIATWNVNSVRARIENIIKWLKETNPTICLLQETKTQDKMFPMEALEELGYNIATYGQKSYNGVAILSKLPFDEVRKGLPGIENTQLAEDARYIEADIQGKTFASIYVPNGRSLDSPLFPIKLEYLRILQAHLKTLKSYDASYIVGGDYNIAFDEADVYEPEKYKNSLLFSKQERDTFRALINDGNYDMMGTFLTSSSKKRPFSWWDYRRGSWEGNKGLRIDYLIASPDMMDAATEIWIDSSPRGDVQPSDHAPVCCKLE